MLLIGSRAICFHLPTFRKPWDWDLIATEEELMQLTTRLPAHQWPVRPNQKAAPKPTNQPDDKKHFFTYEGNLVEVARARFVPYWAHIHRCFADAHSVEDPALGALRVAPLDFLLLTKQCGLVYPIMHWHKNLRDAYLLRDFVPSVSPQVAALWPECMADSARMFKETHAKRQHPLRCCHPALPQPLDRQLHLTLHQRFSQNEEPIAAAMMGWDGFPTLPQKGRKAAMIAQLVQEAQVVAVEQLLANWAAPKSETANAGTFLENGTKWLRWTLREMAIGPLPIEWRYFVVNHYREIRDAIPADWIEAIADSIPALLAQAKSP